MRILRFLRFFKMNFKDWFLAFAKIAILPLLHRFEYNMYLYMCSAFITGRTRPLNEFIRISKIW